MPGKHSRRRFVTGALAAAGAASLAQSLEEHALLAADAPAKPKPHLRPGSQNTLPTGKIGNVTFSRIILGGNLLAGFAHSRELVYVSALLKHYHTEEKILETLEIAEAHGITTLNTNPTATKVVQRYRKERRSKLKWIVQGYLRDRSGLKSLQKSIDAGADAIYIQGANADRLVEAGKTKLLDEAVRAIQAAGVPAGIGGHELETIQACEKAGLQPDFYVKTLHTTGYFSARRPDQPKSVLRSRNDNFWCLDAKAVIDFMKSVKRPWIAFKVMAAGAIHPRQAFRHAFANGADFVLAGMFDFQIAEDARIAKQTLAKIKSRPRPWQA